MKKYVFDITVRVECVLRNQHSAPMSEDRLIEVVQKDAAKMLKGKSLSLVKIEEAK